MNRDELMKMAREAGSSPLVEGTNTLLFSPFDIQAFASAILERAAVECESAKSTIWEFNDKAVIEAGRNTCDNLAKRIRALKTQGE